MSAPRTRNSYIPLGVVTRGLGSVEPGGGTGRATRGMVQGFPHGVVPSSSLGTDPAPLLSTLALDGNGIPRLLSDDIVSLHFSHAGQQLFFNPDREYTGFSANGFWYTDGKQDPTHVPFKASWATEGEGEPGINRSDLDRMPRRLIIAATALEVAIFNADTLNMWMRFELGVTVPAANGKLVGKASTRITEVRYSNGFLVIATNEGLRIADFRQDRGVLLLNASAHLSVGGLVFRNLDTFLDGVSTTIGSARLQNDDCLALDINTISTQFQSGPVKGSRTVAAIGHPDGITAVQFDNPNFGVVRCVRHPALLEVGTSWDVEDDQDADNRSPFFIDDNFGGTNWSALGVRPGDLLTPNPRAERVITKVENIVPGRRLSVNPEFGLAANGPDYSIRRVVGSVLLSPELHLYFSNGTSSVAVVRDTGWITSSGIFNNLNVSGNNESEFAATVSSVNGMAKRGDTLFIATSLGVFSVTDEQLDSRQRALFRYSTEAVTEVNARFKILVGDEANCAAVSVDPETGNVMVAVTDIETVVTEINPNIEQAFRYFDRVGRIKALVAYRNPPGPPDTEPEEAP